MYYRVKIIPLIFITLLFSACISTRQFSTLVKNNIETELTKDFKKDSAYFVVKTDMLKKFDEPSKVKSKNYYIIPLMIYWGWGKTVVCEINSQYYANLFSEILQEQATEFQLQKHLGDKKLEITLEKVPEQFSYSVNSSILFIYLNYYFIATFEKLRTEKQDFTITYRLLNGSEVLKKDTLTYSFNSVIRNSNLQTSTFIENYISDFRLEYKQKSADFIQRIIEEL